MQKVERSEQIVVSAEGLQTFKKKKKPEILLLSTAISTCWVSHSRTSLLLMLHTAEINTPTLKAQKKIK